MKNMSREKCLLYLAALQLGVLNQNLYSAHSQQTKEIISRKHANKLGSFWHRNLWKSEVYNLSKCKWISSWKKDSEVAGLTPETLAWWTGICTKEAQCKQSWSWTSVWATDGDKSNWKYKPLISSSVTVFLFFSFLILTFFQSSDNEKCQNNGCALPLFLIGD